MAIAQAERSRTLYERAGAPTPAASVVVFRILFGLAAAIGSIRFLLQGWIDSLYLNPQNHLTYAGFDWVQPLPSPWMHLHMALLAALGVCIALGFHYRIAIAAFAIGFTYVELIDSALYLNHYWWVTVASFVMIGLPLHHMWSLDARAGRVSATANVPAWTLWTIRGMLAVVYVFAGLAKLQPDWLLHAQPMQLWLADRTNLWLIGPLLDEPVTAYIASWAGAFFDCTIVGWLLWSRSRKFAYVAVIGFHVATAALFQIGMFPWLMIAGTLVFFRPDWPLRLGMRFEVPTNKHVNRRVPIVGLCVLLALQVMVPLRHLAYEGDVRWTEEGYYGAWRVMLTEKAGTAEYRVVRSDGTITTTDGREVLTDWQLRQAAIRPDLLVKAAHLLREHYGDVEVFADVFVSFNGRSYQQMIDPAVDLSRASRAPGPKTHVLPLRDN